MKVLSGKYIRVIFQGRVLKWLVISIITWQIVFNFLGKTELSFFADLQKMNDIDRMKRLCSPNTPAIIVAHDMDVPAELIAAADIEAYQY